MIGRRNRTRVTETTKPTLMTRLKGPNARHKTYKTEVTRQHGVVAGADTSSGRRYGNGRKSRRANNNVGVTSRAHHHRKPSIGDKISGAMMKLRGSLTHRPGEKAAGTRRMRGTDGRGSRRVY